MSAVAEGALLPSQRSYRLETQRALKTGALEVTPSAVTQRTLRLHEFTFLFSVEALNISVFVAWRACVGSKLCWGDLRKHGRPLRVEGVEACVPVSDSETDEVFWFPPGRSPGDLRTQGPQPRWGRSVLPPRTGPQPTTLIPQCHLHPDLPTHPYRLHLHLHKSIGR